MSGDVASSAASHVLEFNARPTGVHERRCHDGSCLHSKRTQVRQESGVPSCELDLCSRASNEDNVLMPDERTSWNQRYRQRSHSSLEPDPLLVSSYEEFIQPLLPKGGIVLDVAGGVGRHGLWLAQRNWKVDLVDISEVGIAQAKQNAGLCAANIRFRVEDLRKFSFPKEHYDLVLVFFYLERTIFPDLLRTLRPGGLLLYKTYTREQGKFRGGPSHPMYLLKPNELLEAFSELEILFYRETIRQRGLAELVAKKF
jgi:tellurite methyltransferase